MRIHPSCQLALSLTKFHCRSNYFFGNEWKLSTITAAAKTSTTTTTTTNNDMYISIVEKRKNISSNRLLASFKGKCDSNGHLNSTWAATCCNNVLLEVLFFMIVRDHEMCHSTRMSEDVKSWPRNDLRGGLYKSFIRLPQGSWQLSNAIQGRLLFICQNTRRYLSFGVSTSLLVWYI